MAGAPRTMHARQGRQAAAHACAFTRLVEEACNRGDLAILDELVAPPRDAGAAGPLRRHLAAFRAWSPGRTAQPCGRTPLDRGWAVNA